VTIEHVHEKDVWFTLGSWMLQHLSSNVNSTNDVVVIQGLRLGFFQAIIFLRL